VTLDWRLSMEQEMGYPNRLLPCCHLGLALQLSVLLRCRTCRFYCNFRLIVGLLPAVLVCCIPGLHPQSPHLLHDNLQRKSHKPFGLLLRSRYCSYYVSRQILAPLSLWLQKHTDLRAHDFAPSPCLWHQPRLAKFTCVWGWRFCGITTAIPKQRDGYTLHLYRNDY
jgi:hypothetical protein